MDKHKNNLMKDIAIIALSVLIAIILVKTGILISILASSKGLELLGSFIAGIFFRLRFFRWLIAFLGALVIASPLPDELGLMMMGFSKMRTLFFIPISFLLNSLGILI